MFFIGTPVIVPEFPGTVTSESEISNRSVATIHVVAIEKDGFVRLHVPSRVFGDATLRIPIFLTNVLVRDLVSFRAVQMERTQRAGFAIDVVSVEEDGVTITPIVRGCPLLKVLRLTRLTRVRHLVVKLPPVLRKVSPNALLSLGDARLAHAVV